MTGDNQRRCAMEPRSRLKRSPQAGLKPGTAKSVGQRLTYCATGAPFHKNNMFPH